MKQKLEIAADLVSLETGPKTITAPQNNLVFLLHPLTGLSPIDSTHRIHRGKSRILKIIEFDSDAVIETIMTMGPAIIMG